MKNEHIQILEDILDNLEYDVYTEYQFAKHLKRKFRADYFIPINQTGLLIEYNGLNFRDSNFSRHSNSLGLIKDMEKRNLAVELGYAVLEYNCKSLENIEIIREQILTVIERLKSNYAN